MVEGICARAVRFITIVADSRHRAKDRLCGIKFSAMLTKLVKIESVAVDYPK